MFVHLPKSLTIDVCQRPNYASDLITKRNLTFSCAIMFCNSIKNDAFVILGSPTLVLSINLKCSNSVFSINYRGFVALSQT